MLRPNLLLLTGVILIASFSMGRVNAQHFGSPQAGPYQQQPLLQMPQSTYQAPIVDHYVQGPPKLWDDQQPVEWFLGELARRSWLRVEYLHWGMKDLGDSTAGAPVTGITDRDGQFTAFDNLNGGVSTGIAELFSQDNIDLNDASGVRGTWGLDLNGGQMELSFFGTQEAEDSITLSPLRNFRTGTDPGTGNEFSPNIALPFLTSGNVATTANMNALIFDDSASATMASQVWGTELSFLTDTYMPGEGFHWQWLGGFRYLNLDEQYGFRGVFDDGGTIADRVTTVNADTTNNVYGPQIGARAAIVHRWFTLAATPRISFGLNDYNASVSADPLGAGATSSSRDEIDFCTITQLTFSGEVHLSTRFSLYGGYDFMWLPTVARPHESILYDSAAGGAGFIPSITVADEVSSFLAQGFSIGATFRY